MKCIAKKICEKRKLILGVTVFLMILSLIGMKLTKINYDILVYLPQDIETIKGQNILTDSFNMGSYSIAVVDGMDSKEILALEEEIKNVDGVNEVISLYDVLGTTVPVEMLPYEIVDKVHQDGTDILMITFSNSTSSEETIEAVSKIREISSGKLNQSGMSSMVLDTMNLSEKEIIVYIIIAVILCTIVLELAMDSYIVPFILLGNIGVAILLNMGTNVFLGEISYITKALVAVLQLGVTTDFSIFLYHAYQKKKESYSKEDAMIEAIVETFTSVTGSSLTTIAGFLVLCTMQLTLGRDLGIVMAKGVLLGVITVLTLFPSLLLTFDKIIDKTKHKNLNLSFSKLNNLVIKRYKLVFGLLLILIIPIYLANSKVDVYYKLDRSLPETLESIKTNEFLKEKYNIVSPEIILIDKNLKTDEMQDMVQRIENTEGIDFIISSVKLEQMGISNILSDDLQKIIKSDKYQMMLVNSTYDIATDELNSQVEEINKIVKEYDSEGIVAGEGPLMKDLVKICDSDFKNVNYSSVACIFIILFVVLKSLSLPFLLIISIESAIFTNMAISYFGGVTLPFIASIVLGTIQLGATIDYAILLTTTYLKNRGIESDKKQAMKDTLNYCVNSIFTSGMCFFAATFGVGIYSKIEMIGSLCTLISRGAIISMIVVMTVLPSVLLVFDKLIMKTTLKGKEGNKMKKNIGKISKQMAVWVMILGVIISLSPINVFALEKKETVYAKTEIDGNIKNILVSEQLINDSKLDAIDDYTELEDIINISNNSTFIRNENKLLWNTYGKDILYKGTIKKELPVNLDITYKLNGEKMTANEMLGKSGRVNILLKYKNMDKHITYINGRYEEIYTPFVITMGTIIDNENNYNIQVTNGKIVSNGEKNIIVGISTPGLYESLGLEELRGLDTITISYDTDKFELSSIYSVISPKLIERSDLEIFNRMDNIYSQVDGLQSNMNTIDEGAQNVKKGSTKLKDGLTSSIDNLKNNTGDALTKEQIDVIKEQTVGMIKETFTDEYRQNISDSAWQMVEGILNSSSDETVSNYVKDSVTELMKIYLGGEENLVYYGGCLQGNNEACMYLNSLGYQIDKVMEFQNALTLQISTVAMNTSNYVAKNVTKEVSTRVSEMTALEVARNVSEVLAPKVANQVKNASLEALTESLNVLYSGVLELDTGINNLSDGISKYNNEGIKVINNLVNNTMRGTINKINELTKLSENYTSFGNKLDNANGETQFILITDGLKVENKNKVLGKEEKKETLWERIKNLFK